MGKRETNFIWTPGLQSDGHCCVVTFSDKDTVQKWRPGITPLPAASQEPQLLLLTRFAQGTDDFLLTAGPQGPLWPTDRPGWACSTPTQSWRSLHRGMKRKGFTLCLKPMLQITTRLSVVKGIRPPPLLCKQPRHEGSGKRQPQVTKIWHQTALLPLHRNKFRRGRHSQVDWHQICNKATK